MKITHVVENLNRGGLERMVIELAKCQRAAGHACEVVCLYERGGLAPELDALGIPVHACGKRNGFDVRALRRLRSCVRAHGSEVLHTHNAVAHYQAVLATLGVPLRCVVNTRHGMGGNRRAARREWFYRRALARTDAVVTVCAAAREAAIARGIVPRAKSGVIPNGIRVESFVPASRAAHDQLCVALGVAPDAQVIGTVGRLNWAKDQATLIRAFAQVRREHPRSVLALVGDGEMRASLANTAREAAVADTVHFLGDRGDVGALLPGFDLFALSSVSEGYSMALLEAAASALPIVATDVGGNREIVRHGQTGLLVAAGDAAALAGGIATLLGDAARAQRLAAAAHAWVVAEGSLATMAARYEALYAHGRWRARA